MSTPLPLCGPALAGPSGVLDINAPDVSYCATPIIDQYGSPVSRWIPHRSAVRPPTTAWWPRGRSRVTPGNSAASLRSKPLRVGVDDGNGFLSRPDLLSGIGSCQDDGIVGCWMYQRSSS